ncbi:MAG TPA: hypothetical protein VJB15_09150 [Rhodothermia bacterium]|nr:hypothetical protein [Rhodothermia bacterium]
MTTIHYTAATMEDAMAKHTPGPWNERGYGLDHGVKDKDGRIVAHVVRSAKHGGITHDERDANASLIAAAPELLEALKAIVDGHKTIGHGERFSAPYELLEKASAAIDKAEGKVRA